MLRLRTASRRVLWGCAQFSSAGEGSGGSCSSPTPQVPISLPVGSALRNMLHPGRNLEVVLQMLNTSKHNCTSDRIGGQWTPVRFKVKCDHVRAWLIETDSEQHQKRMRGTSLDTPEGTQDTEVSSQSEHLKFLVFLCLEIGNPRYLEALIGFVRRNKLVMTESHYNQLLISMDKLGWRRPLARNFRRLVKIGIKCRIGTMFTLVLSAVQRRDYRFAAEVMQELTQVVRSMCSHNRCGISLRMDLVVDGCVGAGWWGETLVGQVLEWHRAMEVDPSPSVVDALIKWLKRCVRTVQASHCSETCLEYRYQGVKVHWNLYIMDMLRPATMTLRGRKCTSSMVH